MVIIIQAEIYDALNKLMELPGMEGYVVINESGIPVRTHNINEKKSSNNEQLNTPP